MITKLLDGLEVFLDVGVMSLKSIESFVAIGPFLRKAPVAPVIGHRYNRSLTALY